ncbi:hypothetical protein KP509_19G054100 [Ceratopteris richardii]|uniref:Uncharacterized protein n=1 Tax=Ceratopteris richardii TaxID=49495 RepID=A0A8T2SNP8_CERRI|nr:hypothetical protein KP509_19G054100 [Ceratopteris richardii]
MHAVGSKVVVVGERFCAPFAVELDVSQKSALKSDFEVRDPQNRLVFKLDSHALSLHDKKVLVDQDGNPILCAHKAKLISAHEKWEASLGDKYDEEKKLFWLQKAKVMQFKTHLEVFLPSNPGPNPDFTVKGDFLERQVQIFCGEDSIIAEVKRKMTASNVLMDKHSFVVTVWPNVDQAFIATLVVVMDEIQD